MSQNLIDGLEAVLEAEQPDLVIYLGDQVEGTHPFLHLGDNEAHVKRVIDQVLEPVVSRGIPFAVVFGNHDAQDAGVPKEVQMAYYRSFSRAAWRWTRGTPCPAAAPTACSITAPTAAARP